MDDVTRPIRKKLTGYGKPCQRANLLIGLFKARFLSPLRVSMRGRTTRRETVSAMTTLSTSWRLR
jgi:hypothetical protein